MLLFLLLPIEVFAENDSEMTISAIACGSQGDSTLVESNGEYLLMDTCLDDDNNKVVSYLTNNGVTKFDLFLSHYHSDHYGKIYKIISDNNFKINKLYLPEIPPLIENSENQATMKKWNDYIGYVKREVLSSILAKAKEKNIQVIYLAKGDTFKIGNSTASVFGPIGTFDINDFKTTSYDGTDLGHAINNYSLVTKITSGNISYLTAGDIEKESEIRLLNSGVDLHADIMKLSHHGGLTSNTKTFLDAVNPKYTFYQYNVETVFNNTEWTKTSVETANKFSNVLSTTYNGNITYKILNDKIEVSAERNYKKFEIHYVDKETSKIIDSASYAFEPGTKYYLYDLEKNIKGYTFLETNASVSGDVIDDQIITVYYTKNKQEQKNEEDNASVIQKISNVPNTGISTKHTYIYGIIMLIAGLLIIKRIIIKD